LQIESPGAGAKYLEDLLRYEVLKAVKSKFLSFAKLITETGGNGSD
jgi:hypothetical protein